MSGQIRHGPSIHGAAFVPYVIVITAIIMTGLFPLDPTVVLLSVEAIVIAAQQPPFPVINKPLFFKTESLRQIYHPAAVSDSRPKYPEHYAVFTSLEQVQIVHTRIHHMELSQRFIHDPVAAYRASSRPVMACFPDRDF